MLKLLLCPLLKTLRGKGKHYPSSKKERKFAFFCTYSPGGMLVLCSSKAGEKAIRLLTPYRGAL
jgi:hypothetical protein